MTKDQAKAKAEALVTGMIGFGIQDTIDKIAGEIFEVDQFAAKEEHDKIEKFIGTAKFTKVREMISRAQIKWKGSKK